MAGHAFPHDTKSDPANFRVHVIRILFKDFFKDLFIENNWEEIINSVNVEHYKNLRHDMKDKKRVHVGHFVLVFRFMKSENKIILDDFDHHDTIYK